MRVVFLGGATQADVQILKNRRVTSLRSVGDSLFHISAAPRKASKARTKGTKLAPVAKELKMAPLEALELEADRVLLASGSDPRVWRLLVSTTLLWLFSVRWIV